MCEFVEFGRNVADVGGRERRGHRPSTVAKKKMIGYTALFMVIARSACRP